MLTSRKLLAAQQLGWIPEDTLDQQLLETADQLATARAQVLGLTAGSQESKKLPLLRDEFVKGLNQARLQVSEISDQTLRDSLIQELTDQVIAPVKQIKFDSDRDSDLERFKSLAQATTKIELSVREAFQSQAEQTVGSSDESVAQTIARFDESSRWQRAINGLLSERSGASIIDSLREKHDVELIVLTGDQTEVLLDSQAIQTDTIEFPTQPSGVITDLSSQFSTATRTKSSAVDASNEDGEPAPEDNRSGNRSTAIVLITDGQHNAGPSPIQSARVLGGQGAQFYPVATGANEPATDLAILEVTYPERVFQTDTVRGSLRISDQMKPGTPFVVQIENQNQGQNPEGQNSEGQTQVLWSKQLLASGNSARTINFEFDVEELVEAQHDSVDGLDEIQRHSVPLQLNATIIPVEGETETSNNNRQLRISAITQSQRILILEGRSRWETRYLRNAFKRDSKWIVNTVIAGPGNDTKELPRGEAEDQFPKTRDDLFDYDLIVFGEISTQLFTAQEFEWIREFVAVRGGGIVFIDGQRQKLRLLNKDNLAALLPVKWLEKPIEKKPTRFQLSEKGAATSSLAMSADESQNREFWSKLPPPHQVSPIECLPGAEVLAEVQIANATLPVMVTRTYGAGRVLFMAFDETWRWRYKSADKYHQRIWNQLAQLVMPQPFSVSDELVAIDSGGLSYNVNESVGVRIRLNDTNGKPVTESTVEALIWKNGQHVSTVTLNGDQDVPGIYRGDSGALNAGDYEVSVRASGFSDGAFKARSQFVVEPANAGEMQQTAANETLLKEMAAASGGQFLREEEIKHLPEILEPLSNGYVVESDTLLWQSYFWFGEMIALLTTEWILRKRIGLL